MESTGGGTGCGDEGEVGGGSGRVAAAAGTSRWNPTKEQIRILEEMYKQGIRTPTAEQIQQITGRLKEYGHIEGKNVFYWFQNHKARQRQKEKQESLALLSRYFHHRYRSAFPSPCPNVICGPYCVPPSELGLYPIHPKVLLPCGVKRRQRSDFIEESEARRGEVHNSSSHPNDNCYDSVKRLEINALDAAYDTNRRTLDLFPLHPTGIEDGNTKEVPAAAPTSSLEVQGAGSNDQRHQDYFDFFSSGDDDGCCG